MKNEGNLALFVYKLTTAEPNRHTNLNLNHPSALIQELVLETVQAKIMWRLAITSICVSEHPI